MSKLVFGKLGTNCSAVGVIMAGGHGTRFWPASRKHYPKQFLSVPEKGGSTPPTSLIQKAAARLVPITGSESIVVSTGKDHLSLVKEHLPNVVILCEPVARNTAPCIGYAALKVLADVGDVPMICVPADHLIEKLDLFHQCLKNGLNIVGEEDVLCTIGIKPTAPETGFGYIRRGIKKREDIYQVEKFFEKPSRPKAEEFFNSGEYYWNSGMFLWRPRVILNAISEHIPRLAKHLDEIAKHLGAADEEEQITTIFQEIDAESIDYGVMEKANNVVVLSSDFSWSDVGSWAAWDQHLPEEGRDEHENYLQGEGVFINSRGCTFLGGKRFLGGVGLEDLIIVETDDALLVCNKNNTQEVKQIIEVLKKQGREDLL